MATILSKTFDTAHGAVFLNVKDAVLGNISVHTIYVAGLQDVQAAIDKALADVDAQAQAIKSGLEAAGWTG